MATNIRRRRIFRDADLERLLEGSRAAHLVMRRSRSCAPISLRTPRDLRTGQRARSLAEHQRGVACMFFQLHLLSGQTAAIARVATTAWVRFLLDAHMAMGERAQAMPLDRNLLPPRQHLSRIAGTVLRSHEQCSWLDVLAYALQDAIPATDARRIHRTLAHRVIEELRSGARIVPFSGHEIIERDGAFALVPSRLQ